MSAPELETRDLEMPVRQLIAATRKTFLLAFYGRGKGVDDFLDIDGRRVLVVSVRSELDLRRRLLDVSGDEYTAFLIPWRATSLPIDLQGRFASHGKLHPVGPEERLYKRFNVSEIDPDVATSPLAEHILADHCTESFTVPGGRLTLDALWTAYLARVWKLDAGGELALDALLGWAAVDARGPQFATMIRERKLDKLRDALLSHLDKKLGTAASLIWKSWEAGQGAATLELGLVLGALAGSTDRGVEVWTSMTAKQVLGAEVDKVTLVRLGEISDAALRFLTRAARGDTAATAAIVRPFVLAADQRASDPAIVEHVASSTRLPSAWRARLESLGRALSEVAAAPSVATVQVAIGLLRGLWHHEMALHRDQSSVIRRAEMAVRLASWLVMRPDRELVSTNAEYGDVETLAGWYASEGGHLDRARRFARGSDAGLFGRGVQAIVGSVDAVRRELDLRFARALPAWHRAGRRATQVVPIDQAVKRIATDFLDENTERRLLVILMDGMAWSQAVELLESMGERASVWGPLAWHGMAKHRVGESAYPAVLTNFPTITEVSRSAFFGGKAIPAGAATDASNDTVKWRENRDVKKHVSANAVPQLRLRGEGQSKDGSASPDALELVLDPSQRIVAVVINAIDMSLKADRTHEVEWKLENVKALRELLDKAHEARRAVLLCSDHGHVPADLMVNTGTSMTSGARWRVWQKSTDPVADYEVALAKSDGVWAPKGADGIVMIADETHRYGGGTGSGEHGGASLAEVVAPCMLIGCADSGANDDGQVVRPAIAPSWWFLTMREDDGAEVLDDSSGKKPRRPKKLTPANQVVMPGFTPAAEPPPLVIPRTKTKERTSPLAGSELFQVRTPDAKVRQHALRAVEFLRGRKGITDAAAFAAELGEFPTRVGGVVAKLQEVLNVDGYQVLRFDRQAQQVHLDLEKLAQQFDVKL
ncbi:MAG: BREX-2 system phosphatase PglZ [Myxococcota bacterium]|nr:BREX-2 system phosphatase PglZ [Myxococcota bacterium]